MGIGNGQWDWNCNRHWAIFLSGYVRIVGGYADGSANGVFGTTVSTPGPTFFKTGSYTAPAIRKVV